MFCNNCGTQTQNEKSVICLSCGCYIKANVNPSAPSKTVLIVAALFLGGLGVHQFLAGRFVAGIFSLLFCWTFIPAIIGLLQGINLAISDSYYYRFIRVDR